MVSLPLKCASCGRLRYHYSHCECPDGRLSWLDQRRRSLCRELEKLDAEEREILGLKPQSAFDDLARVRHDGPPRFLTIHDPQPG